MAQIERMHGTGRMSRIVIHGDTVYLCGQVGTAGDSVADQTRQILEKIEGLLDEAGSDKTKILQAIIWLASMDDFAEMNEAYATRFAAPPPARTTVGVAALPMNAQVEIELVAKKP